MMTRPRRAKNRHTARHRGLAAIPAAVFITAATPVPTPVPAFDTAPLWLPGLRPAPAR